MAYEKYYKNNHSGGNSVEIATPFVKVMRNVYAWMTLGLLMTALTAVLVASTPSVIYALASSPMLIFALFALELGMVIWMSARIHKMAATTAGILFALYAVLNGVTMSFIFLAYAMESIATTFLITAGTFGAMTLVGYTTKKDLSALGRTLMMLLIGLIIATLVNLFVASSGLAVILNYAGVLIFVGLTAYDTQKIKQLVEYASATGDEEQTTKLALMGSLTLYLDFINLFLYLLRIFGRRR